MFKDSCEITSCVLQKIFEYCRSYVNLACRIEASEPVVMDFAIPIKIVALKSILNQSFYCAQEMD